MASAGNMRPTSGWSSREGQFTRAKTCAQRARRRRRAPPGVSAGKQRGDAHNRVRRHCGRLDAVSPQKRRPNPHLAKESNWLLPKLVRVSNIAVCDLRKGTGLSSRERSRVLQCSEDDLTAYCILRSPQVVVQGFLGEAAVGFVPGARSEPSAGLRSCVSASEGARQHPRRGSSEHAACKVAGKHSQSRKCSKGARLFATVET